MPDLPEVTQEFTANVQPYIDALLKAGAAAEAFARKAREAGAAAGVLGVDAQTAARMLDALENAETLLIGQSNLLNAILREVTDTEASVGRVAAIAAGALDIMATAEARAAEQAAGLAAKSIAAKFALESMSGSMMGAAGAATVASGAFRNTARSMGDVGGLTPEFARQIALLHGWPVPIEQAAKAAGNAGTSFRIWGTGIRLTGNALHWLVMGTGEILATAIPAVVAFGSAVAAMGPTFTHIGDQMNYLRTATGSWSNAMAHSVGPLAQVGAGMAKLREQVAPQAYIIFGAAINSLTGHIDVFAKMTQQAANVLAQFASKLSAELQGPLGNQLTNFFRSAVTYMQQWGAVLGNLAHALIGFFNDMAGVGHLLLDVLVFISAALSAIANNPVGRAILQIVTGFSALYRYAQLLIIIFGFMNKALIAPFIGAVKYVYQFVMALTMAEEFMAALGVEVAGVDAELAVMDAFLGPIGWAMLALGAIVGGVLVSNMMQGTNAVDKLIASVQKAPMTLGSLENSFRVVSKALQQLPPVMNTTTAAVARFGPVAATAFNGATVNSQKLVAQLQKTASQLVNLVTGMAQAGVRTGELGQYMQVLAFNTALSDSKIQALNQAIDTFVNFVIGGLASVAQFATGLNQLGQIAASTGNALTRTAGGLTLTAGQFSQALSSMSAKGASAWTNLTSLIGGAMQQTADWFRTARAVAAASSAQVNTAILSMVGSISKYVGANKTAQQAVLLWAQANGIAVKSYPALMAAVHAAHGNMGNLTKATFGVVGAMSSLSSVAKSAAAALNSEATAAIAAAALKASGFDAGVNQLNSDIAKFGPNSAQVHSDLMGLGGDLNTATGFALTWGNQINTSANTAATGMHSARGKIEPDLAGLKGKLMELNQQGFDKTASTASKDMGNVASTTHANMAKASSAFDAAKQHAQTLQSFLNSMHGVNIVNTITWQGSMTPPGGSGGHGPFHGAVYGYQGGGYVGSGMGGMDRVPAMLTVGEAVLTRAATTALGGPLGIRNLNDNPHLFSQGGGGASGTINITIISPVSIDGHKISTQQRTETLIYNRRNPTNNLQLRNR